MILIDTGIHLLLRWILLFLASVYDLLLRVLFHTRLVNLLLRVLLLAWVVYLLRRISRDRLAVLINLLRLLQVS